MSSSTLCRSSLTSDGARSSDTNPAQVSQTSNDNDLYTSRRGRGIAHAHIASSKRWRSSVSESPPISAAGACPGPPSDRIRTLPHCRRARKGEIHR